jgi:hypothetical protein
VNGTAKVVLKGQKKYPARIENQSFAEIFDFIVRW